MISRINEFYNKIKTPSLFSILVTYCCYISMEPIKRDAGYGYIVLVIALSYISGAMINENIALIKKIVNTWWDNILLILVYVYFNISLYGFVFLEKDGLDGFRLPHKYYVVCTQFWIIPLFFGFMSVIFRFIVAPLTGKKILPLRIKIIAFLLLMLNYSIWLYAFNPCISSWDSADLFNQAHQMLTVPMEDWHPPFYAIVLSFLLKIVDSVSFLIIVQFIAFSILLVSIIDYMYKQGCRPRIVLFIYIVTGFSFNNALQMVTLWKDIPYMISITWLTFLLTQLVLQKFTVNTIWHYKFVLALVFTGLFRQNGILPAVAVSLSIGVFAIVKKQYRILISIFVFLIVICVIKGPVYKYYRIESVPGLKFFALANDIIGTYYEADNPSKNVEEIVYEVTDNNIDDFEYNPYYTKYSDYALGSYSIAHFLSIYLETFVRHPRVMFTEFMRRNSVIWSVAKPAREKAGCVNYKNEFHLEGVTYSYPFRKANKLTIILSNLSDKLTDSSVIYILVWRTGIYTLVLLATVVFLIVLKKAIWLLVFIPIIFNTIALYAGSGWTDYRYYWPIAVITVIFMPFTNAYIVENS